MAYLIEHYGGAFPVWLAPVQLVCIPIADRHLEATRAIAEQFIARDLRVEVDARAERMQAKIRAAQLQKVPYMAVIGDREIESGTVNLRVRDGGEQLPIRVEALLERLSAESHPPA